MFADALPECPQRQTMCFRARAKMLALSICVGAMPMRETANPALGVQPPTLLRNPSRVVCVPARPPNPNLSDLPCGQPLSWLVVPFSQGP